MVRSAYLNSDGCLTAEGTAKVRFELRKQVRTHLGDRAAEMKGDGSVIDDGQTLVDADVAKVTIEKTETDRNSIVDGVKLGKTLGRQGFKAQ
jgi:hypothetical protein